MSYTFVMIGKAIVFQTYDVFSHCKYRTNTELAVLDFKGARFPSSKQSQPRTQQRSKIFTLCHCH